MPFLPQQYKNGIMPTKCSYAIVAAAGGKMLVGNKFKSKLFIIGMCCAALPNVDVFAFRFGIPYENTWGHRGITHSLFYLFYFHSL